MREIRIKALDRSVSAYCLGTMYFGTKVPENEAFRLLDLYAGQGGNFIDSANKYASWVEGFEGGESERLIGKWLSGKPRDAYVITSKVGFAYGSVPKGLGKETIVSECEKSLRRLKTDYIDIYFAHAQDEHTPVEEMLEAFSRLTAAGKIRAIGASNYDAWRLAEAGFVSRASGLPSYAVLQQRHTLFRPVAGADFGTQKILSAEHIDYCSRHGIVLMGYSPLLGGLYERCGEGFPVPYRNEYNELVCAEINRFVGEFGVTASQLVLGTMLYGSPAVIPLVTASRADHLERNLEPPPEALVKAFRERIGRIHRSEVKY